MGGNYSSNSEKTELNLLEENQDKIDKTQVIKAEQFTISAENLEDSARISFYNLIIKNILFQILTELYT